MIVIPAIDVKDGRCVRLYQGDYSQVTVFSEKPAQVALSWQEKGAQYLHVVDLDGAAAGRRINVGSVSAIVRAVSVPVEISGGVRTIESIEELLELGADRVILGTAAVENRELVAAAVSRWPERIVLGIDARNGLVATRGWKVTSEHRALDLAREMVDLGVKRVIYTDINRDCTLTEPNFHATADLVAALSIPVIASGGVASVEHLKRLRDIGVEGAIVGQALYTGEIDLSDALVALREN